MWVVFMAEVARIDKVSSRSSDRQQLRYARSSADVRAKISGKKNLKTLEALAKRLNQNWLWMSAEQIAATRLHAEICFKRLAKIVPDLKQVEHTGNIDVNVQTMDDVKGILIEAGLDPEDPAVWTAQ